MNEHQSIPNHEAMPHVGRQVDEFRNLHGLSGDAEFSPFSAQSALVEESHAVPPVQELITPEVMERQLRERELQYQLEAPVREQQEKVRRQDRDRWMRTEKIKIWKSRMKKAIAVTALVASVKGGGFIDMAADPFVDAGDVAASAIPQEKLEVPNEIDGIQFEDYSADTQEETIAESKEYVEDSERARETVISIFSRADKEGYDGIIHDAQEWKLAHSELFVDEEKIKQIVESIDESKSNRDTLDALSTFMSFYDIKVGFGMNNFGEEVSFEDKQGEVKDIAQAYIKVFSSLPKDFIALSNLERVSITKEFNDEQTSNSFGGTQGGEYSPSDNEVTISTISGFVKYAKVFDEVLVGTKDDYTALIAHELSHAFDEHGVVSAEFDSSEQLGDGMAAPLLEQIARNVIDRPESPSIYGKSNSQEFTAEVSGGLLSDSGGTSGISSVEQTRQFSSKSNKAMINALYTMEKQYPGIAQLLIANRFQS